ncbi:hypothetical protein C6P45_001476 [Maudiozyma exigua]|uniref:Nucleoporin Nup159/Nup146 N-terminal domain-containing protein n=1 Tax=Maudiozyma exigua TaxID=34358 RepID=A0A9P7BD63_MAUEX|nr:hypothetical protein C6P45_001476 [Kazachstania exigua]
MSTLGDEIPTNTSEDFGFKSLGQKNILPSSEENLPFSSLSHFNILNGKSLYIAYSNDRLIIGDLQILREFIENKEDLPRDELDKKFEETIPDVVFCGFNANAKAIVATRSGSIITIDTNSFEKEQESIELHKTILTAKLHHNLLWILDDENQLFYFDPITNETSITIKEDVKSFDLHNDKLYLLLKANTENILIYEGERSPKLQSSFSDADEINEAIEEESLLPIDISFVSDNQLLLVYGNEINAETDDVSYDQKMYIAEINEDGSKISFHESFDIAPAFGSVLRFPSFYNILLNKLIPGCEYICILGSSCASELTIYDSKEVVQPSQDSERAVLPISQTTDNDTNPTGIALDISTTGKIFEVCLGVDQIERLPLIYVLNNEGDLQIVGLFHSTAIKENKFDISNLETVLHKENRLAAASLDSDDVLETRSAEPTVREQEPVETPAEESKEKPLFGTDFGSNIENPFTSNAKGSGLASPFANLSTKANSEDQKSTNTAFSSVSSKPFSFGQASTDQSSFGQSSFGKPAFGQLQFGETSTEQPSTANPAFGKPTFGQSSSSDRSDTAVSAFGKPAFGTPGFGQASVEQSKTAAPAFGKPAFDETSTEQVSFGKPSFGQSAFTQSATEESSFGKPIFGSSTFGQTSNTQSTFGTPNFGQPSLTSNSGNAFGKPAFGSTSFGALNTESPNNNHKDKEPSKPLFEFNKTDDLDKTGSGTAAIGKLSFGTPSFGAPSLDNTQSSAPSPFGKSAFGTPAFSQAAANPSFTVPSGSPFSNLSKKESPFVNLGDQKKEELTTKESNESKEEETIKAEEKNVPDVGTIKDTEESKPETESLIGSLTDRIKKSSNLSSNDLKSPVFGQSSETTVKASPSPFSSFADKIKNPTTESSPFSLKDNPALQLEKSAEEETGESEITEDIPGTSVDEIEKVSSEDKEETTLEKAVEPIHKETETDELNIKKEPVESLELSTKTDESEHQKEHDEESIHEGSESGTEQEDIENLSEVELPKSENDEEIIDGDMEIIEKTKSILNINDEGMFISDELKEYTDELMSLESFTGYPVAEGEFSKEDDDEDNVEEPDAKESYEDMTGIADSDSEGLGEDLLVSEEVQAIPETVSTTMQTETPEVDDKCIPYVGPVHAGVQTRPYETSHFKIQAFEDSEQYLAELYKPKPLSEYYTNAVPKTPRLSEDPIMGSMEKTYYMIEAELSVLNDNVKNFDVFFEDQCTLELEKRSKESLPNLYTWRLSEVDRLQKIVDDLKTTCDTNNESLDKLSEEISDSTVKILKTENEMNELKEFIHQVEYLTDSTKDNKFRSLGLHQAKMQAKLRHKMNKAYDEIRSIKESLNIMKVYISKDNDTERSVLLGQMTDIKEHHEGVLANIKKLQGDIQKLSLVPFKPKDYDQKAYEELTKEDITSIDIVELGLKQNTKRELGSFFKLLHK